MVIKGASRSSITFWVGHLQNTTENDRAELVEKRGLAADDLRGMMLEMQEDATGTRCKNFMYIASFNPAEGEVLTEAQWDKVYEIFEKERGIPEGQQRIVYEHEKKGRIHRHVVWNRIDVEHMRAFPDGLDLKVCEAAKHKIEAELDLKRTPGLLNRDPELPPAERRPKSWEMFRGMKSGIDPLELKAELTGLYKESANAADFVAGLEAHGYTLCIGDRRGFVILDQAGHDHSLARRLDGIKTKQLNEFMDSIDRDSLPSVDVAKERYQERKAEAEKADRATVADEIAWEEALAKAAIAKEEKERRFVETEPRQAEPGAAQPEKKTDAELLADLAGPLAGKPEKPKELEATPARIWEAMQSSDNAPAFIAALAEHRLEFARVHEDDRRPHKETQDAREELDRLNSMRANGVWSFATGGAFELPADAQQKAYESYEKLISKPGQKAQEQQPDFESYVQEVQKKNAERMEQLKKKSASLDFADGGLQPSDKEPPPVTAKTGAYVIVDERGAVHDINQKTTGLYPAQVQSFFASMDKKPVQSVTAARGVQAERREAERMKRATNIKSGHRTGGKDTRTRRASVYRTMKQGLSIVSSGLGSIAKALESLFAPPKPLTRAQIKEENRLDEIAAAKVERMEGHAAYDAEHADITAKQQEQIRQQQLAAEQHERLRRDQGRERDR